LKGAKQMQAQAYEGYFKQGSFFSAGKKLRLPENRKIYITILEEPAEVKSRELMFGCLRGEYKIANDFDAPLEDFREYME
jgi:hypothetical protein